MSEKLKPIEIDKEDTNPGIFDRCHEIFKNTIATKDRPKFGDREIYIPIIWIENKAEIFWHSASMEQKPQLDIKPCNNDIAAAYCEENCVIGMDSIVLSNGDVREKCIYRAVRVGWISEVIHMYNVGDPRVRYWEKVNSKKRKRLYLQYLEDEINYLVVFEEKSQKRVRLITAYPVFFISAKKDYEKDYQNYIKEASK